jgi:hypothetical protein
VSCDVFEGGQCLGGVQSTASTPENTEWWLLVQSWHENIPDLVLEIKDMKRHWDCPIHVNWMKI